MRETVCGGDRVKFVRQIFGCYDVMTYICIDVGKQDRRTSL